MTLRFRHLLLATIIVIPSVFATYNVGLPSYATLFQAGQTAETQGGRKGYCQDPWGYPPLLGTYGTCPAVIYTPDMTYGVEFDGPTMRHLAPDQSLPVAKSTHGRYSQQTTGWNKALGLASPFLLLTGLATIFIPLQRQRRRTKIAAASQHP